MPKLRSGSLIPEDALGRYQRVDRAVLAAVAETCATGTSTGKARRAAAAMGIEGVSRDRVGGICQSLDPEGWRHVLGAGVADAEGRDSRAAFLGRVRERGVRGARLVTSDAHEGLERAVEGEFRGATRQGCAVRLMRDCARAASGSRRPSRRVSRVAAPVFRLRDACAVRTAHRLATEMLEPCCPGAARLLEEGEPDAPACLDFPAGHWERLRTNNLQERTTREMKRRSRVVQVFPSEGWPGRLAGAVMCDRDEARSGARCFSGRAMSELPDETGAREPEPPTGEQLAASRLVARRAIEANLELADELEAA